jgi:hypothetical protein
LWLFSAAAVVSLDALFGSHLNARGMISSMGMIFSPYLAIVATNRWLRVDEKRAVSDQREAAVRWHAAGYRCLSLFVVLPLLLGAGLLSKEMLGQRRLRELSPVYQALRNNKSDAAWNQLQPMIEDEYWTTEQLALAALVLLRDGNANERAKEYVEAAVVRANTSFSKACGTHTSRIERGTCDGYVSEIKIHDAVLEQELHRRFCAVFGQQFPQPEPELSGCGSPAPTEW